jgi:hypothetical protein
MSRSGYATFNRCNGAICSVSSLRRTEPSIEITYGLLEAFVHQRESLHDYIVSKDTEGFTLTKKSRGNVTLPLDPALEANLTEVDYTEPHRTELTITHYPYLDRLSVSIGALLQQMCFRVKLSDKEQIIKINLYHDGALLQEIAVDIKALIKAKTLSFETRSLADMNGRISFAIFGINEAQIRYNYQSAEIVDHSPGTLCPIQNLGNTLYQHPRVRIEDKGELRSITIDLDQAKIYRPRNGLLKLFLTKVDDPFYIYEKQIIDIEKLLSARKGKRQHSIETKLSEFSIFSEPLFVEE